MMLHQTPYAYSRRLNAKGIPFLYGAFDIKTCIHECRASINDTLYIATIKPLMKLKLLHEFGIRPFKKISNYLFF